MNVKNDTLIISPTGTSIFFDDAYDKNNHWRFVKPERTYVTCIIGFNDEYVPEPNTYDFFFRYPVRYKWKQLPELLEFLRLNGLKWEEFSYIGYWDDDYCTDIPSVNRALQLARRYDFPFFQQSLTSWTVYPCLEQKKEHTFARTNFTEMGVCFYRQDIFRKVLWLLESYKYRESEWGIDKIMCDYIGLPAAVVHETSIKHMRRESWYDKTNAFAEMAYLTNEWFPEYMRTVRGETGYIFRDVQQTLATFKEE